MKIKTEIVIGVIILLAFILLINKQNLNNIHNSVLGRLIIICIIIFVALKNITLGLLVVFSFILLSSTFNYYEGMENNVPTTIGEDNVSSMGSQKVLTSSATKTSKLNENKVNKNLNKEKDTNKDGIDKESIKLTIMPKNSKHIPVDPKMNNSDEVEPSSQKILDSSSKLEGFALYAA